jgi:3-isopropylmalate/(R)-2-methylmalate dehydratase small subunit
VKTLTSHVVPLVLDDIDTDQIIPARFLKTTEKEGLGKSLFSDWRYDASGNDIPEFALNKSEHQGAQILVAGHNFGCGSSREHAPWALAGWGLRVIVARSFADIFRTNALKCGLLPVELDGEAHARLVDAITRDPAAKVSVDVPAQTLTLPGGAQASFPLDSFAKHCLVEEIDELGYLLALEPAIRAYEERAT